MSLLSSRTDRQLLIPEVTWYSGLMCWKIRWIRHAAQHLLLLDTRTGNSSRMRPIQSKEISKFLCNGAISGDQPCRYAAKTDVSEMFLFIIRDWYLRETEADLLSNWRLVSQSVHLGVESFRDSWPDFGCGRDGCGCVCRGAFSLSRRRVYNITGHGSCLC
jgi:hypothetical protein